VPHGHAGLRKNARNPLKPELLINPAADTRASAVTIPAPTARQSIIFYVSSLSCQYSNASASFLI
jgi:hypothetical protein